MTQIRHRREGIFRTLVSDATQGRTSLRYAPAPGPKEWPSQHGICLDIGRTSCQLRTAHNPAFTFQQLTIVVCLDLTRLEWETWSTHAPMKRILRYCPAINATSVSGTIRASICGLRPQITPIPTVASINRYTHRCRYTPRSCFRPDPQDWAHNVSSAVVKP